MPDNEKLILEIHGKVYEMAGKVDNLEQDIRNGKEARRRIHERQDRMEKEYVKKSDLANSIEVSVIKAISGRKRAVGLIVKDIILALLGSSSLGFIILSILGKL